MTRRREPAGDRLYRALLRLFPAAFRREFGDEMTDVFREERGDVARTGGRRALARLWGRTIAGVARAATREHGDILRQDVAYALRTLRRSPAFAAVAVLTLAIGIGANAAIFGVADALIVRPLPVPRAGDLVRIYGTAEGDGFDIVSYPTYRDLRDRVPAFGSLAAHRTVPISFNAGPGFAAEPLPLQGELVSGDYFATMGVGAALGRLISPDDDRVEGERAVAVVSHALWTRRLGGAPDVLGRTVFLNGAAFEIVGVAPEGFRGSFTSLVADLWLPLSMHEAVRHQGLSRERRGWGWLSMTGRLAPGASLAEARAQAGEVARQLAEKHPRTNGGAGVAVYPATALPEQMREGAVGILAFAAAVVGLVLLVACANLAGVMQARVESRRRETAIRQSLGAGRLRLARQWLTESLVIAALGGAAGLVVARWTIGALEALRPPGTAYAEFSPPVAIDGRVLLFTAGLVVLTGLLFGLWPALGAGRSGLSVALGEGSTRLAGGRRRARTRRALTAAQVAVSLVLLVVAGLLLQSVRRASALDVGFESRGLALMSVDLRRFGYPAERAQAFYDALTARLETLPGVSSVSAALVVPLGFDRERITFLVDGQAPPDQPDGHAFDFNLVAPRYFETMGIPIVEGRGLEAGDDRPGAPSVAVINETLARRFFPGESPLGHTLAPDPKAPPATVVGVARDIKYYTLAEDPRPYVYASARRFGQTSLTLHVRATGDAGRLLPPMRAAAVALDPNLTPSVMTFDDLRAAPLFPARAMAALAAAFGLIVLLLATIGLYGTLSTLVADRGHEIGVRMAFGATRASVFGTVVGQAMALTAAGLLVGAAGAAAASRVVEGYLVSVGPLDPPTYVAVAAGVLAIALVAAFLPARRAARVDPAVALRE